MNTTQALGSLIPFNLYGLSWALCIVVLFWMFGGMNVIRWKTERETFFHPETYSFIFGDSLGLPLLGGGIGYILVKSFRGSNSFYTGVTYHWIILITGVVIGVIFLYLTFSGAGDSGPKPAEVYHWIAFVPLFYVLVSPIPAVLSVGTRTPIALAITALGGLIWSVSFAADMLHGTIDPNARTAS